MKKTIKTNLMSLIIGALIVVLGTLLLGQSITLISIEKSSSTEHIEDKPLYWVAPMDANYKRDKPGKSPMGMDLVPVYERAEKGPDEGEGTIRVSASVINNLGVRTSFVGYKPLENEIKTVGYVAYDEDKLVHIHPRVEGWIEKLYVKVIGATVSKGQPLYAIYSPELVNAQEEFLLALERQNTRLVRAAENRLSALQLPKYSIEKLKKIKKVQQTVTFYSPQNGVVENLKVREGFFVKPGSTLMSIGDLSEVWVEAELFERQAGQVKIGAPVTMTVDYLPGKSWRGVVDYIYPTLDAKTRTVKVRIRFKNEAGEFKPNMFAQITINTMANESVLSIPKEALIRTGNQDRVVLALGEGSFKSVAVSVGRFGKQQVEILEGLNEGEQVVSSAQFLLDSESSKSSDFKRMNVQNSNQSVVMSSAHNSVNNKKASSATTTGTINNLMIEHGMINISRAAIDKWDRPAAIVDFIADEGVSLDKLSVGMEVEFTFEVRDGQFIIIKIATLAKEKALNLEGHEASNSSNLNKLNLSDRG